MRAQNRQERIRQLDRASALLGLRLYQSPPLTEPFERVAHRQHAAIEIQIPPREAEDFALPQSTTHGNDDQRIQAVLADRSQERPCLLRREALHA